jgi:hypothetical protein
MRPLEKLSDGMNFPVWQNDKDAQKANVISSNRFMVMVKTLFLFAKIRKKNKQMFFFVFFFF